MSEADEEEDEEEARTTGLPRPPLMSEADEEEDEEEADDEEDPPPLPFSLRLWSTATIRAAKEVFKEHFTKTIVGDCDFGYPYKGEVDSRGKLTTLGKLNKELEELIKQKKRSDPYKDHPFYKEEREAARRSTAPRPRPSRPPRRGARTGPWRRRPP